MEAARSAASSMDGCVVAVQVEHFGLPKSAVSTAGQTNKFSQFRPLIFKPSRFRIYQPGLPNLKKVPAPNICTPNLDFANGSYRKGATAKYRFAAI